MDSQILSLWGIQSPMFPPDGSPEYVGPQELEAHSRMLYAVESGLRCVLVHGPQGVGKTRLALRFAREMPADRLACACLDLADRSSREFLSDLGVALGAVHRPADPSG